MENINLTSETAAKDETQTNLHNKNLLDFYLLILTNYQMLDTSPEARMPSETTNESAIEDYPRQ